MLFYNSTDSADFNKSTPTDFANLSSPTISPVDYFRQKEEKAQTLAILWRTPEKLPADTPHRDSDPEQMINHYQLLAVYWRTRRQVTERLINDPYSIPVNIDFVLEAYADDSHRNF